MASPVDMQCHLGDVPGGLEPACFPPYRLGIADEPQGWVEWLKTDFIAWVAAALALGLAVFILWLLFLLASQPSLAA